MISAIYELGLYSTNKRKIKIIRWFYENSVKSELYEYIFSPNSRIPTCIKSDVTIESIIDLIFSNSIIQISSTFDPVVNPIPENEWLVECAVYTHTIPYYAANLYVKDTLKSVKNRFKLK